MFKMSKSCSHQRGMGMLGVIFIVGLAAFFMTLLFKLGPAYMNFLTIRTIMNEVAEQSPPIQGGARGVSSAIDKRLNINSLYGRSIKDFTVKKIENNTYNVTAGYEDRQHLFYNVDAVLTFDYQVEVKTQ